jgi:hypothetical protein
MIRRILVPAVFLAALGCAKPNNPSADGGKKPDGTPAPSSGDQKQLEKFVMAEKPTNAITVKDVLAKKEGEKVVVTGQVPTPKVKPYNAALAAVVLISHADMARDEVKEEFDCDDAATCPGCKKLLDTLGVRVEIVDASGAPVGATLEGYRGLKPGSTITVEGEVKREGKDKKLVRIVATKFYPG